MRSKSIFVVVMAVILLTAANLCKAVQYEIIDLGNFGFSDGFSVTSINNFGQITILGHSGGNYSSFLYDDGVVINLGGSATRAYAINDQAIIVGQSEISGVAHAFIYENGSMTFIGGASEGRDINQSGQILCQNGLIYDNGVTMALPKPTGYESWSWYAEAINDNGDVTGYLRSPDLPRVRQSFSYIDGIISILNVPEERLAFDINNSGQIVGTFLGIWENGVVTGHNLFDAINNAGQAVGGGVLYDGENYININTLISPSLGWDLTRANCINDNGWIVGEGFNPDGDFHAFLLTPEPATLFLLGLGAVMVRKKQKFTKSI
ncbi:MAG: PEP-CTERM sorting domain-containing protein [Deltaproteobacteria bacterium]|nr:PEP-CTERM sorting domain-containing protein [Deltaproteobacteria bacterium]